jgi:hypothetical protein
MRDGSVAVEGLDGPPRRLDGRADRADLVVAVGGLGVATPAVRAAWDAQMVEGRMIESPVSVSYPRVVATHQWLWCHSLAFPRTSLGVRPLVHLPVWARWVL